MVRRIISGRGGQTRKSARIMERHGEQDSAPLVDFGDSRSPVRILEEQDESSGNSRHDRSQNGNQRQVLGAESLELQDHVRQIEGNGHPQGGNDQFRVEGEQSSMGHENSTPGLRGNHSHRRLTANFREQDDGVLLGNIRQRQQQMESERRVGNDGIELNNFRYGRGSGRSHNSIAYDFVLPQNQFRPRARNNSVASNRLFGQDNARNGSFHNVQANRREVGRETQRESERSSLLSQAEPVLKLVNQIGEKLEQFEKSMMENHSEMNRRLALIEKKSQESVRADGRSASSALRSQGAGLSSLQDNDFRQSSGRPDIPRNEPYRRTSNIYVPPKGLGQFQSDLDFDRVFRDDQGISYLITQMETNVVYSIEECENILLFPEDERYGPQPFYDDFSGGIIYKYIPGYGNPPVLSKYYVQESLLTSAQEFWKFSSAKFFFVAKIRINQVANQPRGDTYAQSSVQSGLPGVSARDTSYSQSQSNYKQPSSGYQSAFAPTTSNAAASSSRSFLRGEKGDITQGFQENPMSFHRGTRLNAAFSSYNREGSEFQSKPEAPTPQASVPRHPTFHLKAAEVPKYSGSSEDKSPYDFLIELEKYQAITRSSDQFMIDEILPLALSGEAFAWYRFTNKLREFGSWNDFKKRFRKEYQSIDYAQQLSRTMEDRYQGPDESLTSFIRTILSFYERMDDRVTSEKEKVEFIKRHIHPDYLRAMQGKRVTTISDLVDAAAEAQDLVKYYFTYRRPSVGPTVEPSLQYRPVDKSVLHSNLLDSKSSMSFSSEKVKLHPHGVDPFSYFHNQESVKPKQVAFETPKASYSWSKNRSESPNNSGYLESRGPSFRQNPDNHFRSITRSPVHTSQNEVKSESVIRSRTPSPGLRQPRLCFNCSKEGHLARDCPENGTRSSENSRAPSPVYRRLGGTDQKSPTLPSSKLN
jgi:hypothetical protein